MPAPPNTRVFISYARKDASALAQRLHQDLAASGLDLWLDTARLYAAESWTVEIERAIDCSEVVLALLTPGSCLSDICRAEQLRSLRRSKKVIPLLAAAGASTPSAWNSAHAASSVITSSRPLHRSRPARPSI